MTGVIAKGLLWRNKCNNSPSIQRVIEIKSLFLYIYLCFINFHNFQQPSKFIDQMLVSRVNVTRFNTLVYIHGKYEYRLFMNKFAKI